VSIVFAPEKITGLIGETGCGKSVLAMAVLRLLPKSTDVQGIVRYGDEQVLSMGRRRLRRLRAAEIALIPQNPAASLNPIHRLGGQVAEGLRVLSREGWAPRRARGPEDAREVAERVLSGLGLPDSGRLYPFQLSGGMRQRGLSALALVRRPAWILADEPTKGLDAELRRTVALLLRELVARTGAGLVVISHDIPLARSLCQEVAVMYAGKIMESGPVEQVLHRPLHPYTRGLLAALPDRGLEAMEGTGPAMSDPPRGCVFHPRCPARMAACSVVEPPVAETKEGGTVSCHLYTGQRRRP